ncbi:hypothetical protein DQ04_01091120 [Trypanosoma grayi]|uniref:hypothetical protein n=1 Tax=Trypanosoma grayi TaxID=71804 RepID=UPI0004F40CA7|nr:hypothetical protein DQ04_01091120 [Trypanosoma grayi]KEG13305.1 hypothetical protein DQ04_01091120 [Trypanosoma grayi]
MLRWMSLLLLPHRKGAALDTRRLVPQRHITPRRALRRGALLAELDRPQHPHASGTAAVEVGNKAVAAGLEGIGATKVDAAVTSLSSSTSARSTDAFLIPSRHARKLERAAMSVNPSAQQSSSARRASADEDGVNSSQRVMSLDALVAQQTALREMFNEAERRCIRLRKDMACLQEERRAFHLSHNRAPSDKEVSPFVDVALAPTAALKLVKHLSPRSSAREAVEHSIRLQQSVAKSKLVQSGEQTLFRCLRCFSVYAARPRTLLRDEVAHSWLQYEVEKKKVTEARELAQRPHLRKRKYSLGRQREARARDPRCCPMCGSPKAQWLMEYVHHRTHA